MMKIIYHSRDLDGHTSGAILRHKFPEAELIGYDYGQPVPEGLEGHDVIMVDCSFDIETMLNVASLCNSFVFIDHHISVINEVYKQEEKLPGNFTYVLQEGVAACELAWEFAFPGIRMPYAVKLLGMYDTWRNQDLALWEQRIMPFQYGMRTICKSPETFPVDLFRMIEDFEVDSIIQLGRTILEYQDEQNARIAKGAFTFGWKGYQVIAINGGGFSSNAFKSVYDPLIHDLMMPFAFNGKFWVVSIYTEKDIDCSALAKEMGGGGHKKAAGFQVMGVNNLPFIHLL